MASWVFRLFRAGHMPNQLRQLRKSPGVVVAGEAVPVVMHGRGVRAPGTLINKAVALRAGSVLLFPDRIVLAIGRRVLVHATYQPGPPGRYPLLPLTSLILADGLHLHLDVPRAQHGMKGTFDLHAKIGITPEQLAALPAGPREITIPVTSPANAIRTMAHYF